ncbi:MAG: S-adenosylmethionine:tRNA ribosyltransferase-isomerase [Bacteroidales bacterium]|nr:S-adenosylmethionine:tRNA ribosyltransferase-isomerase [Bacteroidales bacterium]
MDISHYQLSINQFDYNLPEERIARYPLPCRDMSKLLVYENGQISERVFRELPELLPPSDLMVFNNTKVVRARLRFDKETGAHIEIFCLEPVEPAEYETAFAQRGTAVWKCLVGNRKKWKGGQLVKNLKDADLQAEIVSDYTSHQYVRFTWDARFTWGEVMDLAGVTPIPPYLNRETEQVDDVRYQTVYSRYKGSVAAPTAGLHFTPEVLENLRGRGIRTAEVTLHVGAGTFKPVTAEFVKDHEMHEEFFTVDRQTVRLMQAQPGRITAVGTTSVRTIESLYWMGVKLLREPMHGGDAPHLSLKQFEAYALPQDTPRHEAMQVLLDAMDTCGCDLLTAHTGIMIMPGYHFRMTDAMVTNFHQPKSTLLLLVSAFIGDDWKQVYDYALAHGVRFLSYGDSSLLVRSTL